MIHGLSMQSGFQGNLHNLYHNLFTSLNTSDFGRYVLHLIVLFNFTI